MKPNIKMLLHFTLTDTDPFILVYLITLSRYLIIPWMLASTTFNGWLSFSRLHYFKYNLKKLCIPKFYSLLSVWFGTAYFSVLKILTTKFKLPILLFLIKSDYNSCSSFTSTPIFNHPILSHILITIFTCLSTARVISCFLSVLLSCPLTTNLTFFPGYSHPPL